MSVSKFSHQYLRAYEVRKVARLAEPHNGFDCCFHSVQTFDRLAQSVCLNSCYIHVLMNYCDHLARDCYHLQTWTFTGEYTS